MHVCMSPKPHVFTTLDKTARIGAIYLVRTQITDAGVVHLKGLNSLQSLNLWDTQITNAGLVHLKGLTSLQTLYLDETQVTDAGLVHLSGLTSLQTPPSQQHPNHRRGRRQTPKGIAKL